MEETVNQLLEEMTADELSSLFEHSKRTSAFKFKKPELTGVSKSLANRLKDFKSTSTVFKGQRLRVRITLNKL
jgi:hypothetical protein